MKIIVSLLLSIWLSFSVQGQIVFSSEVKPEYNTIIQDTLYEAELSGTDLPDCYHMCLELIDTENNILFDTYNYYLQNPDLCTEHNNYLKAGNSYRFYLGSHSAQIFQLKANITLKDVDGNVLYNTIIILSRDKII